MVCCVTTAEFRWPIPTESFRACNRSPETDVEMIPDRQHSIASSSPVQTLSNEERAPYLEEERMEEKTELYSMTSFSDDSGEDELGVNQTSPQDDKSNTEQNKSSLNPYASALKPRCNSEELRNVECQLENKDLWEKFNDLGTEMIITKMGRRMFPTVRVTFTGLASETKYAVFLDIVPVDNKRYRYAYHRSSWLVAGKADPPSPTRLHLHSDSPFVGDQLKKQVVSFEKIKLTNNEMDKQGHIVLNSMHKYQPRIHIVKLENDSFNFSVSDLDSQAFRTFIFPETIFTAVTAYQNQLITKLKIDSNPFAKGFRDSSRITEIERESIEAVITNVRSPLQSLLDVETDHMLLRDKITLLNLPHRPPFLWNPSEFYSNIAHSDIYRFLSTSPNCMSQFYSLSTTNRFHPSFLGFSPQSPPNWHSATEGVQQAGFMTHYDVISGNSHVGSIIRPTVHHSDSVLHLGSHRYSPYPYSNKDQVSSSAGLEFVQTERNPTTFR
ncbi:T-box protein 12-like isoform X2 [Tachypleus tridentatus]|uniref:T-box protein 12-like isoform X2 n=1 Tax=Tachypleus tridentatus TaxID=6853 RepID=UPI003FD34866